MRYYTFGDVGLYIPFYNGAYQVVREVFIENIYEKLIGCDKILDLGAYIGDSALYFASHGSKVVGYEMNQNIYALGLFNTYSNPLIQMHYGAVISTNKTHIHAQMNNMYDNTGSVVETPSKIMVPAYNIVDIVNHDIYDGLKMDIEGSEYDIIQKLIDTNLFCFVRGIIEFHETHKKENSINIDNFVRYLHKHQYKTEFFHNKDGTYVNGHSSMRGIINFYFQKI